MTIELIDFLEVPYDIQLESRNWRNQKNVAEFFKIKYITEEVHKNWLEKLKENKPQSKAFFIKDEGRFVGVTYFHSINYEDKSTDWGIYIHDNTMRGKGIGTKALLLCLDYAKDVLKLTDIYLEVLNTNSSAIAVYTKLGFKEFNTNSSFWRYKKLLVSKSIL